MGRIIIFIVEVIGAFYVGYFVAKIVAKIEEYIERKY